jgi:hypothetical protein
LAYVLIFIQYYVYPKICFNRYTHYTYRSRAMPAVCWCALWTRSLAGPFGSACSSWVQRSTCAPSSTHQRPAGTPSRVPAWCRSDPTTRTPPPSPCASGCKEHAPRTCRASACRTATTTSGRFARWTRRQSCLSTAAGYHLHPSLISYDLYFILQTSTKFYILSQYLKITPFHQKIIRMCKSF